MSGFAGFCASVMCLLVILTGPSSALFWRPTPPTYPTDLNDPLYQAFQTVPAPSVTADKLLTNFLHIQNARRKKRNPKSVEDNVIVIDGSYSIRSCLFEKGIKSLSYMVGISVPNTDRKYAAVTFASSASVNFKFLPPSLAASRIKKISYPRGMTNTQAGLGKAKELFDESSSGRRATSKKYVFLVTDGQSNTQRSLTIPKANALKNAGVQIQVLAIGDFSYGIDEMVKVASTKDGGPPTPDNVLLYRVEDYNKLWEVAKLMLKKRATGTWAIVNGQYDPPCS